MKNNEIIILVLLCIIIYIFLNPHIINKFKNNLEESSKQDSKSKSSNKVETWRDLPYVGKKDIITYHIPNTLNYSRKSLPIYYPISSPLEDNYFNYTNSVTSPKLSMFRNILRQVEVYTNQGIQPIIYNYAERPIEIKKIQFDRIKILADTVINLINKFGEPMTKVEYISTLNEVHEETDQQSRICFDLKIKLIYMDSEKLGKTLNPDILYIQPEFIFEKKYDTLIEDDFFNPKNKKINFVTYLSKLIVIGSENMGFLGGRYDNRKQYSKRN